VTVTIVPFVDDDRPTPRVANLDARQSHRVEIWREKMRSMAIQEPKPTRAERFRAGLERASRDFTRWWLDRAPWWLVLTVTFLPIVAIAIAFARKMHP